MAAFGMKVLTPEAKGKILDVKARLRENNLIKNPFESRLREVDNGLWAICIKPVYPPFWIFSVFPLLTFIIFSSFWFGKVALVIGLVMFSLVIFWWDLFYFLMFALVTKNKVRYVSKEEILWKVV
jgi:hypothetical protein